MITGLIGTLIGAFLVMLFFFGWHAREISRFEKVINTPGSRKGMRIRLPMTYRTILIRHDLRGDIHDDVRLEVDIVHANALVVAGEITTEGRRGT